MNTVNLYRPEELAREILINVINDEREYIIERAEEYLDEIWSDEIDEFSDCFGVDVSVDINRYLLIDIKLQRVNNEWLDLVDPDEIKKLLEKKLNIVKEEKPWFAEEIAEVVALYKGEPFIVFMRNFFNKLAEDASNHLFKMYHDVEYIADYITGKVPTDYVSPDVLIDNDLFFDENGNKFIAK